MPELYQLKGYNRVRNNMRRLASEYREEVDDVFRWFTEKMADRLRRKRYPPERPGQTYVRTGDLGAGYLAKRHQPSDWAITNVMEYAHWVVSRDDQAWMHRDRWWTVDDEVEDHLPELRKKVVKELQKLAGE